MKTYPMKARIRAEAGGAARIDIFDDIGAGGWLSEGYTPAAFADAIKGVSGPLDVHINSAGGDVPDGIAIANAIRNYPGRKRTVVDGMAASIASVIAQAGDERVVEPGAMVMVHDPLTGLFGNEADFLKVAATLGKHGDNLAQVYAARAGGTPEQWREVMRAETWYTAAEAVEAGLADRVGTAPAQLPQGVDLDELEAHVPGRIMAVLRSMPRAAAGDGQGDGMGGKKCKTCNGKGRLKHPVTGAKGVNCPSCKGKGTYDPDHDGDDDSTAGGDTDHDYVEPDGSPGPKAKPAALTEERVRAILREEVARAAAGAFRADGKVDDSPWDSSKAWHNGAQSDDPEAFYRGICAGHHTSGDPKTQGYWALPYRYHPSDPPNAAGVRAAWGVLNGSMGGVKDLADRDAVEAKVKGLMKQVNPDWEPGNSARQDISGGWLERMRAALPPLKGAGA